MKKPFFTIIFVLLLIQRKSILVKGGAMKNREITLVKKLYSASPEREWNRLYQDAFHKLEFDGTMKFLKKHLPKKGLVLDAGVGPGRYTIELAKMGYDAVLLDLVPENLRFAEKMIKKYKVEKRIKGILEGTITNLSLFEENTFDSVICLGGPLSHVHTLDNREKAVKELKRVVKKGKKVIISVMSKWGVLLATPMGWPGEVRFDSYVTKFAKTGDDYRFAGKSFCHFFTSEELIKLLKSQHLKITDISSLEGLNIDNATTNIFEIKHKKAWKNWMKIHDSFFRESFAIDSGGHMIISGRK
ncbi:MAG: class I SAM-dependent methyltransferase [bacterium]